MKYNLNNENENSFFITSFFEKFLNFTKNAKIELKDIFELLNYPSVYQNSTKKYSADNSDDVRTSLTTSVTSKVDKKNIEKFREYKKELQNMLDDVKTFNNKYKIDIPLLFIVENLITLHLINEYKINNIVKKIQEHNIVMPELNSDLPNYIAKTIELNEKEKLNDSNKNVDEVAECTDNNVSKLKEINSLSINNSMVKQLLENSNFKINLHKLDSINKQNNFHSTDLIHNITYNSNKTNEQLLLKKKEDNDSGSEHKKMHQRNSIIESIGLSAETLKLLNLLPKKRKTDID